MSLSLTISIANEEYPHINNLQLKKKQREQNINTIKKPNITFLLTSQNKVSEILINSSTKKILLLK